MSGFFEEMQGRGFINQVTDEAALTALFKAPPATCYAGFDATADSLHVGHLIPVLALAHLQRHGHRPIAVVGGATTLIGDPSGKTEMRKLLDEDQVRANLEGSEVRRRALLVDNATWMRDFKYIDFLREVGRHFSVNRMLTQESVKLRMEKGLSFIEFNYMILQAYDFAVLDRDHDCRVQFGGSDQWGNIVMGVELCRRLNNHQVEGLTFPLMTTAAGTKMGKTEAGAVWLDPRRTPPYDFYQYWINCADADVVRFLRIYTFVPLEELVAYEALEGAQLREAKIRLAHELTSLVHGRDEADRAAAAAAAAFGGSGDLNELPTTILPGERLSGLPVLDLLVECGLASTKSEARRLVRQGGCYLNEERLDDEQRILQDADLREGALLLRAGKKRHHRVVRG